MASASWKLLLAVGLVLAVCAASTHAHALELDEDEIAIALDSGDLMVTDFEGEQGQPRCLLIVDRAGRPIFSSAQLRQMQAVLSARRVPRAAEFCTRGPKGAASFKNLRPLFTLEYRKSTAVPKVKQVTVPDAISDADSVLGGAAAADAADAADASDDAAMSRQAINAAVRQVGVRQPRLPRWKKQQKKLTAQAIDDAVAQAEATVKLAPWALKAVKAVKPTTAAPITERDDEPMAAEPTLSPIERAVAEARAVVRTPGAKQTLAASDSSDMRFTPVKRRSAQVADADDDFTDAGARKGKGRGKGVRRSESKQKQNKNKKQPAQWNFGPDNGKQTIPRVARFFREKRERAAAKERARILATPEGWMRDRMQKARARHG